MLIDVKSQIQSKSQEIGRDAPQLIAVSKRQPNENVRTVLEAGHRIFGENQVQEAQSKWPEFQQEFGKCELHLLGPLQSNKVKLAMELFDVFHSLDLSKLAQRIAKLAQEIGKCPQLFIQVNIGNEDQKAGVSIESLPEFVRECQELDLPIIGLMCIPPVASDPRVHFRRLAELARENEIAGLSMGMSQDYLIAVEEGATHVRVGSSIFGARG